MGIQIEDGTGSGRSAKVDLENRLYTLAVTLASEHYTNHAEGLAFNLLFQQTPTQIDPSSESIDVCFLYMKNGSETDIMIEEINLRAGGDNTFEIIKILGGDTGTPVGGSTLAPSNLNLGSGNIAEGTFLGGNTITGISGGVELQRIYVGSSNTTSSFDFKQKIVIPKNYVLTLYAVNSGVEIDGTLVFNYHKLSAEY